MSRSVPQQETRVAPCDQLQQKNSFALLSQRADTYIPRPEKKPVFVPLRSARKSWGRRLLHARPPSSSSGAAAVENKATASFLSAPHPGIFRYSFLRSERHLLPESPLTNGPTRRRRCRGRSAFLNCSLPRHGESDPRVKQAVGSRNSLLSEHVPLKALWPAGASWASSRKPSGCMSLLSYESESYKVSFPPPVRNSLSEPIVIFMEW